MARVGIDLDGVCYDFAASLKHYLVNYDGGWLERDCPDPTRWEFYLDWHMGHSRFKEACNAGVDAGVIFTHGDPYPGTREALQRLSNAGHTLHIITDRSFGTGDASRDATRSWLARHDIPFDTLDFSADKTSVPTDCMIDDRIENYDALALTNCVPWLLDRPWNQDSNAWRVDSLAEFVDAVLADTMTGDQGWRKESTLAVDTSEEVRTTSTTGGQKGVKPQRYSLVPALPLAKLAEHYAKGAEKYDSHQWRKGYEWSKSFDALQRHAWAWWEGEDLDPETGSSHVAAVAWHAFALLQFINDYPEFDDRPNTVTA